ncbi:MAG: hypothetical protein A6F70_05050 [Cycloclasticus sp. symbiont of Bathymodiolus heckerae]|nr:MAG: hypothetical protein A6F70_05050 [Cycloclasticus sp. symbiont of Bathymodiolus heckerae]
MLNKKEPDWLSPEEYQMIVAPSLKVCAELAASRGDPTLFQDLPSMVCLIHLVTRLKDYYIDEWAVLSATSSEASLKKAPEAACMMVLTEGNVGKDELPSMIDSLKNAYKMVQAAGVGDNADDDIQQAWEYMKKSEHEQFMALLEQSAKKFVIGIDVWEKTRSG